MGTKRQRCARALLTPPRDAALGAQSHASRGRVGAHGGPLQRRTIPAYPNVSAESTTKKYFSNEKIFFYQGKWARNDKGAHVRCLLHRATPLSAHKATPPVVAWEPSAALCSAAPSLRIPT